MPDFHAESLTIDIYFKGVGASLGDLTVNSNKDQQRICPLYYVGDQGISLLAIAGKVLAKIVLNRLMFISEEVLLRSQSTVSNAFVHTAQPCGRSLKAMVALISL